MIRRGCYNEAVFRRPDNARDHPVRDRLVSKPQKHKRSVAVNIETYEPVSIKKLRQALASLKIGGTVAARVTVIPLDTDK